MFCGSVTSAQLCPRTGRFCSCCTARPVQGNLWSLSHCFHLGGYFQTKNDVCKLFYSQSKKRRFCQNQQGVSKPSRFPQTQRLTQSCDSPSGSSKLGTSLSALISGVQEPAVGWGREHVGGGVEERLNIVTASTSLEKDWKTVILSYVLPYWQLELF